MLDVPTINKRYKSRLLIKRPLLGQELVCVASNNIYSVMSEKIPVPKSENGK